MSKEEGTSKTEEAKLDDSSSNTNNDDIQEFGNLKTLPDEVSVAKTTPEFSEETNELTSSDNCSKIIEETDSDTHADNLSSKQSRELKQLLALSKEAKLDTNITHKRKSLHVGNSEQKSHNERRNSTGSDNKYSDKGPMKFSNKSGKVLSQEHCESDGEATCINDKELLLAKVVKRKRDNLLEATVGGATSEISVKKGRILLNGHLPMEKKKDTFCWRCHRDGPLIACETCPRSYHQKCVKQTITNPEHWPCPECLAILKAESTKTRSPALRGMTLEHLCGLLKFALKRMMQCTGSEPFIHPVSEKDFPNYRQYIVQPMDLTRLEKNIKNNIYGSTQAFEADAKWILHNSIIFNSYQSKFTSAAKSIVKICKQEMQEIENCSTCYLNANTKKNSWFVEVCPKPHLLLWAKLKGFPYWPAKAMSTNDLGMVDVRFFGAHDRAWVPFKDCFLYSRKDPNSTNQKKNDIIECIKELDVHIGNLKKVYGEFNYAPYRYPFDPELELEQLQLFLPNYKPNMQNGSHTKPETNTSSSAGIFEERNRIKEDKVKDHSEDKSMEGYGTDEETEDHIDKYRRKRPMNKGYSSDEEDNKVEKNGTEIKCSENSEDKSEKNIPSKAVDESKNLVEKVNVEVESTNNNTNTSKTKTNPKQIFDNGSQKRPSNDDSLSIPQKLSRRSSDISIKSDSSRLSNISEKINKVDISEDMEISMGNDDTGNISISENFSDASNSSKSETNDKWMAELKRKPIVQVNIENKEFTISPQNKSKISDRLIKKLIETESNSAESSTSVEAAKKQLVPSESSSGSSKTQTDLLLEKYEAVIHNDTSTGIIIESVVGGFSAISSSSTESTKETDSKGHELSDSSEISSTSSLGKKNNSCVEVIQIETLSGSQNDCNDSNEDLDNADILEDTQIDEANIRNIIHSSLNEMTPKKAENVRNEDPLKNEEHEMEKSQNTAKRKLSEIENQPESFGSKLIKLVNQSEKLNKKLEEKPDKTNTNTTKKLNPVTECVPLLEIKPEPCSDDETSEEQEEAKRELFSALNISEKISEEEMVPKKPEIRTRSKTESRFRIVDNLTKVIDTVASTYSAEHEGEEVLLKRKEISIKPLAKMQTTVLRQKARKSFPPAKKPELNKTESTGSVSSSSVESATTGNTPNSKNVPQTSANIMILTQQQPMVINSFLPPNQQITYSPSVSNAVLTMVPHAINTLGGIILPQTLNVPPVQPKSPTAEMMESQNYIPQSGASASTLISPTTTSASSASQVLSEIPSLAPLSNLVTGGTATDIGQTVALNDDFSILKEVLSDTVTKALSEVLSRPPPKLKPKPPSAITAGFDEGIPSSAGPTASKINSVSHRLADYFRGMLVETLTDLSADSQDVQATIASLKLEIETLKHKHSIEMLEVKKNICSILKDMQKNIVEERERAIDETKSKCEAEAIKRVEEAKSKQWCANCLKEAQFYCCWNTSYCDYPCQQKHWPKHMSKCTQTNPNASNVQMPKTSNQQIVLRPAAPPKGFSGKIITKPAKLIVNRSSNMKGHITQIVKSSSGSHLTLVESTPGNYELVGNGPISVGGKFLATTSVISKIKSGNVITVTSPSTSSNAPSTPVNSPKVIVSTQAKSSGGSVVATKKTNVCDVIE